MAVPIVYRKSKENILANYNYVDAINGVGYLELYAGADHSNGISGGNLSNVKFYSNAQTSTAASTNPANTKVLDVDFDTQLTRPLVFKGKAILNVSSSGSNNHTGYIHARIRKWDGTTETEIANASGQNIYAGASATTYVTDCLALTIPQTNFKKNETLRLTIEFWNAVGAGTSNSTFAHDPMNRDYFAVSPVIPTILSLQMPVRLNL